MIRGFRDKRTAEFFAGERVAAFQGFAAQAQRRLGLLDHAGTLRTLQTLPSNRFEALEGDRAGQYSIRINDRWRLCFRWQPLPEGNGGAVFDPLDIRGDAIDAEITDYH